jgi:hypothetical protein
MKAGTEKKGRKQKKEPPQKGTDPPTTQSSQADASSVIVLKGTDPPTTQSRRMDWSWLIVLIVTNVVSVGLNIFQAQQAGDRANLLQAWQAYVARCQDMVADANEVVPLLEVFPYKAWDDKSSAPVQSFVTELEALRKQVARNHSEFKKADLFLAERLGIPALGSKSAIPNGIDIPRGSSPRIVVGDLITKHREAANVVEAECLANGATYGRSIR